MIEGSVDTRRGACRALEQSEEKGGCRTATGVWGDWGLFSGGGDVPQSGDVLCGKLID
jgi:hypothetical protein